jgi:hypothetical protein
MKNFKLLSAVAVAGLLGLSVHAAGPVNYDIVNVKLTLLVQTNDTEKGSTEKFNVNKIKLVTKDVLNQIALEFPSNAAAITASGAQLAVNDFFDGTFTVLDKNGDVVLADASDSPTNDDYELYFDYDNYVDTGSETDSKETENYTTVAYFYFENALDSSYFSLDGSATVSYNNKGVKETESFKFSGAGDGEINDLGAVVTGTAKGSGKFTEE